ncbi:MAG: metal-dependent phosphohydrolase [Pseudomonadota bacterium]
MFNPAAVLAADFGDHLAETYLKTFSEQKAQYADFLNHTARETLELIGASDAPYHNSEHTMMVTLVGQQIIQGKRKTSTVHPEDWLHYILALLIHDIGFVRGVCDGDTVNAVIINDAGERVCPPRGATDAHLAPYHVDRGKIYARHRFADSDFIDPERIAQAIEYTRFPVPDDPAYARDENEPALVRAADLIGQIADSYYLSKMSALYHEFLETGFAQELGFGSPMDLVEQFPNFFHQQVEPLIGSALEHLRQTSDGKELIAQLYGRVSQVSRRENMLGPFPGPEDAP